MRTRGFLVGSGTLLFFSAGFLHCVSDEANNTVVVHDEGGNTDEASTSMGSDGSTAADTGGGGTDSSTATDGGVEAGPTCIFVDAGAHGVIDNTYSNGALTIPFFQGQAAATIDDVGRVYVAFATDHCVTMTSGLDIGILRLLDTGLPDPAFGNGGIACLSYSYNDGTQHDYDDVPAAITVDSTGGVIVAGQSRLAGAAGPSIGRVDNTGKKDPAFGSVGNGMVIFNALPGYDAGNAQHSPWFFAVSTSGTDILVAGGTDQAAAPTGKFESVFGFAARLKATGAAQSDFKPDGGLSPLKRDIDVDGYYAIRAVGGRILLGGNRGNHAIIRAILPTGDVDTTFGANGDLVFPAEDGGVGGIAQIVQQSATRIVTSGGGPRVLKLPLVGLPLEVRGLGGAGAVDSTFGEGGVTVSGNFTLPGSGGGQMSIGCDGHILLGGVNNDTPYQLAYTSNGLIDPSFGEGGAAADPNFGGGVGLPIASLVDRRNGKIIFVYTDDNPFAYVVRYNP